MFTLMMLSNSHPNPRNRASTIASTTKSSQSGCSSPVQRYSARRRSSTNEFGTFLPQKFLFTPADSPPPYTPRSSTPKSISSPPSPIFRYSSTPDILSLVPMPNQMQLHSDSEDDRNDDDDIPHRTWGRNTHFDPSQGSSRGARRESTSLRKRIFSYASSQGRDKIKTICTTPGQLCAGETETEIDEPVSVVHPIESTLLLLLCESASFLPIFI